MKKVLITLVLLMSMAGYSIENITKDTTNNQTLNENETLITLSDDQILVQNEKIQDEGDAYLAKDIIYYENLDAYDSGMPNGDYGFGGKFNPEDFRGNENFNFDENFNPNNFEGKRPEGNRPDQINGELLRSFNFASKICSLTNVSLAIETQV